MANPPADLPEEIRSLDPDCSDLPRELARLAAGGSPSALEIWENFGAALGCGIASLANAFGFERFIIGGGLAAAWEHFIAACRKEIRTRMYAVTAAEVELCRAELGNDAGLIGGVRVIQLK